MNALSAWLRSVISKPADRRRGARQEFKDSIEIRTDSGQIWRGIARDLSVYGMGAVVYADLRVGDSVLVKYTHPDSLGNTQIVARKAVVRSRLGWRYGFEFQHALNVSPENQPA